MSNTKRKDKFKWEKGDVEIMSADEWEKNQQKKKPAQKSPKNSKPKK